MNHRLLALSFFTIASGFACTPEAPSKDDGVKVSAAVANIGAPITPRSWAVGDATASATKPAKLDVALVVKGMLTAQGAFYNGRDYNGQSFPGGFNGDEPRQCIQACPPYYSDIACHYYCWHPSYASANTNIRGCFTQIARGQYQSTIGQALYYPQIYDYCTYQPFDAVKNPSNFIPGTSTPLKFDPQAIDANKRSGTKVGVNAWVDDHERDAFKHVMFTWYDPMLYSLESQQEALNSFYAVKLSKPDYTMSDTADVQACQAARRRSANDGSVPNGLECSTTKAYAASHSRHPQWAQIVQFMASNDPSLR